MTSRKIYAHTHYEVYCPDCFYTIWEGHQIKTNIVRCIKCGQIVHIDWERGISEVIEVHASNLAEIPQVVTE